MRTVSRFIVALLLVSSALRAEEFKEKVTVSFVEVPATVLGRDGAPVRGLTKANFEIVDDGKVRPVESFEAIDFASERGASAISPLNPASRRNFLLLFDLSYSNPISVGRAQTAARNFIARSIGQRDLVAIGALDVDHGFRFLTAFTTDRELLTAAISDPAQFRAFDPLQISGANPFGDAVAEGSGGDAAGRGDKNSVIEEIFADGARTLAKSDDAYRRTRIRRQIEMLASVAHSLQKLAGRKHIVFLSEGFDPRLVQGRSVAESQEENEENFAIQNGEVWKVDSDKRFGNASMQTSITRMAEEFRRADVVLHAVDIQGVRVQNDIRSGKKVNSNDALFMLADSTGGTVFRNSNDISADFDRLTRQQEVVYVLGFQAPVGKPGEYHSLKIRLIDVPNARVTHRGGYYDPGAESSVERALSTAEVITNDIPQDDIGVAAFAAPFLTSGANAQVPVILEIAGADLEKHARANAATTDIFVYAFDDDGIVRDSLFQRITLDMTRVGERLRAGGVRFYGTLSLPPGRYALKSLVRIDETEKMGYQRLDVEVPGPDDVAVLRPMFFEDEGTWVMVKGKSNDKTNAPYPFVLEGKSFIPAARPQLKKGEPRLFTLFVYNAEADELTFEIAPEAKLVSQAPIDQNGLTKLVFAVEHIPADARELAVTVRRKGSADERKVSVPVAVVQ